MTPKLQAHESTHTRLNQSNVPTSLEARAAPSDWSKDQLNKKPQSSAQAQSLENPILTSPHTEFTAIALDCHLCHALVHCISHTGREVSSLNQLNPDLLTPNLSKIKSQPQLLHDFRSQGFKKSQGSLNPLPLEKFNSQ